MDFTECERAAPRELIFSYEHTDIPPGLTLADWRRARPRPERRTLRATFRSFLRRAASS